MRSWSWWMMWNKVYQSSSTPLAYRVRRACRGGRSSLAVRPQRNPSTAYAVRRQRTHSLLRRDSFFGVHYTACQLIAWSLPGKGQSTSQEQLLGTCMPDRTYVIVSLGAVC